MDAQKLPLMVLYDTGESWYVKDNATPIAIFIEADEEAVYVKDIEKTDYITARTICDNLDVENLFWCIPTKKQLQKLLLVLDEFNKTAELIGVKPLVKGCYWSRTKLFDGLRLGVDIALEKEIEISEIEYAFTRPFLRL